MLTAKNPKNGTQAFAFGAKPVALGSENFISNKTSSYSVLASAIKTYFFKSYICYRRDLKHQQNG